jgi:hypothetical protein
MSYVFWCFVSVRLKLLPLIIKFSCTFLFYFYNRYYHVVVSDVDVTSIVLEPTHNKEWFADEKKYHFLFKNMVEYMRQYWSDVGIENYVKEF